MTIPEATKAITQNPITSRTFSPAIPSAGSSQNGCTRFVHAAPQATPMATRLISEPTCSEASTQPSYLPCLPAL